MEGGTPYIRPDRLLWAVAAWIGMVVLAIVNATIREVLISPRVGEYWGHVSSTATLLGALGVAIRAYFSKAPPHRAQELWAIGLEWAGLTVAFELLFGHYVAGDSWSALAEQYDVTAGRVWSAVPLFLLVAPRYIGGARSGPADKRTLGKP